MIISDVMTREVHTCHLTDSLGRAAQLMWEHDVGALPVTGEFGRTVAVVTDRDVCMAAYIQGKHLRDISVATAASKHVYHVHPTDSVERAHAVMGTHRVRRLPVIDSGGHLVGIVSIADIVRHTSGSVAPSDPLHPEQLTRALCEILRPHDASQHPRRSVAKQ